MTAKTQSQIDELFVAWAAEVGMTMDTPADRKDHAARGHLFADPGSDVHDFTEAP